MKKRRRKKLIRISLIIILIIILSLFIYSKFKNKSVIIPDQKYDYVENDLLEETSKTYDDVSILQYEDGEVLERLKSLSKKYNKIKKIMDNKGKYPDNLLEALSRNPELDDFVLNYPEKKNKVYTDNIGIIGDTVPRLYQWDERWGYGSYGESNIAISGCGPTSLAMVISYLKKDNSYTPYRMGVFAKEKGFYVNNSGTTWDLMRKGPAYFGVTSKELPLSKGSIYNALEKGHPIICNMRRGDFTINGHYIVLAGIKDGKIIVNDPNSKERSNILWEYERISNQIKNLWEFYV